MAMALRLIHSVRHAEDAGSVNEPALDLIQGGRDPAAEEAARVAEIRRLRDAEIARISAQDTEAQRLHDERMQQLRTGHMARMQEIADSHAARMKAMKTAHEAAMQKIRINAAKERDAARREYERVLRVICGLLVTFAAFVAGFLLGRGSSPIVLLLIPMALGAFHVLRLAVEDII